MEQGKRTVTWAVNSCHNPNHNRRTTWELRVLRFYVLWTLHAPPVFLLWLTFHVSGVWTLLDTLLPPPPPPPPHARTHTHTHTHTRHTPSSDSSIRRSVQGPAADSLTEKTHDTATRHPQVSKHESGLLFVLVGPFQWATLVLTCTYIKEQLGVG